MANVFLIRGLSKNKKLCLNKTMYVKIKKYRDYPDRQYLQIVESYREGARVRNRTVLNLGRFDNGDAIDRVNKFLKILLPYSSETTALDIDTDLIPKNSKQIGPLMVFKKLWQDIGLGNILKDNLGQIQTFFDLEKAIFNMVLNRLCAPSSKRRMIPFQETIYGINKFDLHQYYRAMDHMIENKDSIEKSIFDKFSGNGKLELGFFDTTTIVFYGDDDGDNSELLDYGFSKARRSDLKQIVVGVLMNERGEPLAHETFPGNQNDVICFKKMIEKMVDKYGVGRVILVGDRGMISHKNIALLEEMGLEYILGYRMRQISRSDRSDIFGKVNLKNLRRTNLKYKEVDYKGKRLIFCYNEERAELDAKHRENILERLKEKIKSGNIESIIENKDYKRYLDIDGKAPKLSEEKIERDEMFDGVFVLTSNAKLTPPQIIENYKGLWQIEQGFKQLKSELGLGPLYHYTDDRIRAHVMICFLALILRRHLAIRLKKLSKNLSYRSCMDALNELRVVEFKVRDEEYHILTEIKARVKKVFKSIKMGIPDRVVYKSLKVKKFVVPGSASKYI